jgi:PAS domain S-box-containing protein
LSVAGTWEWDFHTGSFTWSDGLFGLLGFNPKSTFPSYDLLVSRVHADDKAAVEIACREAVTSGGPINTVFRLIRVDGIERWVAAKGEVFWDTTGRPSWATGAIFDITDIREAELDLAAREERYRALVTAGRLGIWRATAQGETTDAECWVEFTGRTAEECLGSGWLEAVHSDDLPGVRTAWLEAVRIGAHLETSFRAQHHSGQYRWVLCKAVPLRNCDGTVREWVGTTENIQAHRDTEEALRTEGERLRIVLAAARMVTWHYDVKTGHVIRSPNSRDVLGLGSGSIEDFQAQIHPEDRTRVQTALQAAIDTGSLYFIEYRFHYPGGPLICLGTWGRELGNTHQGAKRLIGVTLNMTGEKEPSASVKKPSGLSACWKSDTSPCVTRQMTMSGSQPLGERWPIYPHGRGLPGKHWNGFAVGAGSTRSIQPTESGCGKPWTV